MGAKWPLWGILPLCLASPPAWTKPPEPAPSSGACGILEAAYTAAIDSRVLSYPIDVRPSARSLDPARFVPDYRARMPLDDGEFDNLLSRKPRVATEGYYPRCDWQGIPAPARDPEGHVMQVSFTRPIVSTDARVALVEVSFSEPGFGYGAICVVRASSQGWVARCVPSWTT